MHRILFVCLGNICRSPTAEAAFVKLVNERGMASRFHVDSAGTAGHHAGESAHAETRREAARRGVSITHRARQVTRADFDAFDWLVAMDRQNQSDLLRLARHESDRAKVVLFRAFELEKGEDLDVPDPWYTGEFAKVYDICERASLGLLRAMEKA